MLHLNLPFPIALPHTVADRHYVFSSDDEPLLALDQQQQHHVDFSRASSTVLAARYLSLL
jgi:hypothetical protein